MLPDLAQANAFVRPTAAAGTATTALFAAVLRLKLRREHPGRVPDLHSARPGGSSGTGTLTEAVRHAADAGDWPFAAGIVVDELAVGELIDPQGNERAGRGFRQMPRDLRWAQPQPLLVAAAIGLSRGERRPRAASSPAPPRRCSTGLPAEAEIPSRLAAALIRLALARSTGDAGAAAAAADSAERPGRTRFPGNSSPGIPGTRRRCSPAAAPWHCGRAVSTRPPPSSPRA